MSLKKNKKRNLWKVVIAYLLMESGIKYEMECVEKNDTSNQMVHIIKKKKRNL